MDRKSFRGIFVIVTTPFTHDFALDEAGLADTLEFCLAAGVHGVVANALASEGGYLGEAERKRAAEIVVSAVKGKVPAIVAVSAPHSSIAADHARHAEAIGADAVMALPPTLHPASPAEIKAHYRAIAAATSLPLVLQNVVGQGASPMSAALLAELVHEIPSARFVKEESGYPAQTVGEIIRLCGDKVEGVMGGKAGKTLMEEVRHGVSGTMPACEIADVHVALWNAVEAGDDRRARAIFQRLLPLLDMESNYGMPLMKEVLKMRGVIGSSAVRQSGFRALDDAAREEAATIMDDLAEFMLPAYRHRR
ncbi:dihydrodipicolinate synthase family protein [Devosia sp.]|uniref:dihydrodipicolinate synthase family protein n=1 Tax=Devosia sp. TaxID=1871048 RepID=UPI001AC90930|nr:dihydrodipicolinate synthase family protein [Devosia sp.]MBN9309989.1 dihydrodipicolinate synthase family protein [Devosia sp.]